MASLAGLKYVLKKMLLPSPRLTASIRGPPVGAGRVWAARKGFFYGDWKTILVGLCLSPSVAKTKSSSDANQVHLGWFVWGGKPPQETCPEKGGTSKPLCTFAQ